MSFEPLQDALQQRNVTALCETILTTASPLLPELTRNIIRDAIEKDLRELMDRFRSIHGYGELSSFKRFAGEAGSEYSVELSASPIREYGFTPEMARDRFAIRKICSCSITPDEAIYKSLEDKRSEHLLPRLQGDFPDIAAESLKRLLNHLKQDQEEADLQTYGERNFICRPADSMMILLRSTLDEDDVQNSLLMVRQPGTCYYYHISEGMIEIEIGEDEFVREATDADLYILRECMDDLIRVAEGLV